MTDPVEDPGIPTLFDADNVVSNAPHASEEVRLPLVPGFEVLQHLGQGGMGVVFQARDLRLNRLVALKMIRDGLLSTPAHAVRFQTEARAVARLHHPNIVQIFHVGDHQGRPFLVLELVEGGNLAQQLNGRPLLPRLAAELVCTLANAMHHAHQQGIVHRDLKPANILLTSAIPTSNTSANGSRPGAGEETGAGTPCPVLKITDFGLAKELTPELFLTHSGSVTVLGTPAYMAPEQARSDSGQIGPACDIYSLGAILYECLVGKPPFVAGTLLEVLDLVCEADPVSPRRLNPAVPIDLATICMKCLRKEPGQRYASAQELAEDLERFLVGEPIRARPVGRVERAWKWAARRPAIAVMAVLLLLTLTIAGLGAWHATRWARQEREEARADVRRANYPTLLQQAQQALAQQRPALARRLLDDCPRDVCGWEWSVLSELADGQIQPRLGGLKQPIQAIAFDPVRGHLYAATEYGLRAWDQRTLAELDVLPTGGRVRGLTCDPAGRYLAALVEPEPPATPALMPFPLNWLTPLRGLLRLQPLAPVGNVVTTDTDEAYDSDEMAPPAGEPAKRPPAVLLVPVRRDEVLVWDLATRRLIIRWICPSGLGLQTPVRLAFQPGGSHLAVLAGTLPSEPAPRIPAQGHWRAPRADEPFACANELTPAVPEPTDLPRVLSRPTSLVAFFDPSNPRRVPRIVPLENCDCHALAFTPDGRTLVLGCDEGRIRRLDSATGGERGEWRNPGGGSIISLAFDPVGERLAAGSAEGHVDLWDARSGELLHMLPGHSAAVRDLHFHPHEARLFSLGQDGHLKVWHTSTGQALLTIRAGSGPFASMGLDATGRVVALGAASDSKGGFSLTLLGRGRAEVPEPWRPIPAEVSTGLPKRSLVPSAVRAVPWSGPPVSVP